MRLIMEYKVIEARAAQQLEQAVNEHIQEGWEPLGGVAVGFTDLANYWTYCQAMVRKLPK
jgi:hypothetical protein